MDISAWWVLGAFVVGGYAGALLVALIAMAARDGGSGGHGTLAGKPGPGRPWTL